jgi:hypothetical protein
VLLNTNTLLSSRHLDRLRPPLPRYSSAERAAVLDHATNRAIRDAVAEQQQQQDPPEQVRSFV